MAELTGRDRSARDLRGAGLGAEAPVLLAEGLEVRLGGRAIWSDVDLRVDVGEFVAVLGPNGAGKSTLVKAALGLVPISAGRLEVLGAEPGTGNREIGYLPQRRSFGAGLRVRGLDVVRLGLDGDRWGIPLPWPNAAGRLAAARVEEVVELVGATSFAERPIGELSGGEQQRLLIAQALVRRPRILFLDEPLDSLDLPNQGAIAALIASITGSHGVAVVMVAHDVNPILPYLDEVVYVAGGSAVSGPPERVITAQTLSALFKTEIEVLRTSDGRPVVVGHPEAPSHHAGRHGGHAHDHGHRS